MGELVRDDRSSAGRSAEAGQELASEKGERGRLLRDIAIDDHLPIASSGEWLSCLVGEEVQRGPRLLEHLSNRNRMAVDVLHVDLEVDVSVTVGKTGQVTDRKREQIG